MPAARNSSLLARAGGEPKNLIVNGEFPSNTGNWIPASDKVRSVWDDGRMRFEQDKQNQGIDQEVAIEVGKRYKLSCMQQPETAGAFLRIYDGGNSAGHFAGLSGFNSLTFTAKTSRALIRMYGGNGIGYSYFDNVSLIEL